MEAQIYSSPQPAPPSPVLPLRLAGEERLARLVSRGNEAAFALIYERFHQPVYRYCRSLVGNETDAQDALQTTFTRALVALRSGRRDAPLRPWLFRIAHNESISLLRRRRPEEELGDDPESTAPSPHEVAEERARLKQLLSDLGALPERQRGALVMRELSGLSHEEIGQALGISVGAAKQTVLEARRSLQEFSEGRGMSCDQIQQIVSDGDRRALRGRRVRAHLRSCAGCAAFAEAMATRRHDLLALAPVLPPAAASGLLAKIIGAGSGHGGGGLSATAGATGKGLGVAMSAKTLATGAVVLTTAAVGAGALHHLVIGRAVSAAPPAPRHPSAPLSTAGAAGVTRASTVLARRTAGATRSSIHPVATGSLETRGRALRSAEARKRTAAAAASRAPATGSSRGAANRASRGASASAPGHTRSYGSTRGASVSAPGRSVSAAAHAHGTGGSARRRSVNSATKTHRSSRLVSKSTSSPTVRPAGHPRSAPPVSAPSGASREPSTGQDVVSSTTASSTAATVTTVGESTTTAHNRP